MPQLKTITLVNPPEKGLRVLSDQDEPDDEEESD